MPAGLKSQKWVQEVREARLPNEKTIELLQNEFIFRHQEGDSKNAAIVEAELKRLGGVVLASLDVKDAQGAPVAAHAGGAAPVQAAQGPAIIPVMADNPRVPPAFRDLGPENMYQVGNLIWSAMFRPQQVNRGELAGRILPARQVGGKMKQRDAERFCRDLGGGSRLPTREEYEVLARAMRVNFIYDQNRIPDMSGNVFWSSVRPDNPDRAYGFFGNEGYTLIFAPTLILSVRWVIGD